jgi:deoxycytidylate deaminase
MYEAKSAAGNSACLSRQVGAAITNDKGEIISTGWNDVPKYGGNLYKDGDTVDHRCIISGHCSNDSTKDELSENILSSLVEVEPLKRLIETSEKKGEMLSLLANCIRKSTKVKDLIEFSRSVHAEMHAIIIGSQLAGDKMIGGKLFCTTYPCHNCGRHIIVAGIKEIYYIEPYVKSLCVRLHSDAITEDEAALDKVRILMYDGVAPRRYLDFFTMKTERKYKNGKLIAKDYKTVTPKSMISLQALPILEGQALHNLKDAGIISEDNRLIKKPEFQN